MNKKSMIAVLLIVLLAAVSVFGLPFMTHKIEQNSMIYNSLTTCLQVDNDFWPDLMIR